MPLPTCMPTTRAMPGCQLSHLSRQLTMKETDMLVLAIVLRLIAAQAEREEGVLELKAGDGL